MSKTTVKTIEEEFLVCPFHLDTPAKPYVVKEKVVKLDPKKIEGKPTERLYYMCPKCHISSGFIARKFKVPKTLLK